MVARRLLLERQPAYLIGRHRIEHLRDRAARELGTRFTIKDFHHHVLANGAVPWKR
ncbi:DUF885 family protein [Sphaerisporangium sp. NPDC051017]|uniref:DUF885 family protein n=1 Tax=Sphaerisporangium sp. NPDC051017 TaxID=3154636 RepID=UPI003443E302